jgi:hypothetical protein
VLQPRGVVVIGCTEPAGSRQQFGALLLGYYTEDGQLLYAGRAGTSFTNLELERLAGVLRPLQTWRMPKRSHHPLYFPWITTRIGQLGISRPSATRREKGVLFDLNLSPAGIPGDQNQLFPNPRGNGLLHSDHGRKSAFAAPLSGFESRKRI